MPETKTLETMITDLKAYIERRGDDYQKHSDCTDDQKEQYMVGLFVGLFAPRYPDERASETDGKSQPIFEIRYHDRENFNIYEDGTIEGFPEGAMICNRIPGRILQERHKP